MKKLIIFFLLACPVLAQDMPQPKSLTSNDLVMEIGQLHLQIKQLTDYIQTLQTAITNLQAENAKLRHAEP